MPLKPLLSSPDDVTKRGGDGWVNGLVVLVKSLYEPDLVLTQGGNVSLMFFFGRTKRIFTCQETIKKGN